MIKARYIPDPKFFKQQKTTTLYTTSCLLITFILNFFEAPTWLELSLLILIAAFVIYASINFHNFYRFSNRFMLFIDNEKVIIKDPKGRLIEKGIFLEIGELNLELEQDYFQNLKRIWKILKGEKVCSSLRMQSNDQVKTIYFWIDSHYQLNQFKSL